MQRFFLASLLLIGGAVSGTLVSCAPRNQSTVAGVTQPPTLIKVSQAAAIGETVTVQGRFMGGQNTAYVLLGADADGKGGYKVPVSAVKSWTDSEIVFTVPSDAPVGGSWLYIVVGGMKSANGLPFSIKQAQK